MSELINWIESKVWLLERYKPSYLSNEEVKAKIDQLNEVLLVMERLAKNA
jgi:hypothetical protein